MEHENINAKNKAIWDTNASDWDQAMGEFGNDWHNQLIAPITENLLNLKSGDQLLDIGCGNGIFARRMADKTVNVLACDFSSKLLKKARSYTTNNITYQELDITNLNQLKSLKGKTYNGIAANMVLMDLPHIEPIFSQISQLLTPDGSFVLSIQHPSFNSEFTTVKKDSIQISDYNTISTSKGEAIKNQTEKQYYFHRPLSYYINMGSTYNLVTVECQEPTFTDSSKKIYSKIPPIIILKMKINK
ncbi:MAG: hypothetical protein BM564_03520 [Bacteroidetes bacterium MedPE-SWsnd-G2]|nr:MAG: hypothetical protein BM564_03520 [Bacteroidetes bacterium MedPE-SWsnd-G2]